MASACAGRVVLHSSILLTCMEEDLPSPYVSSCSSKKKSRNFQEGCHVLICLVRAKGSKTKRMKDEEREKRLRATNPKILFEILDLLQTEIRN